LIITPLTSSLAFAKFSHAGRVMILLIVFLITLVIGQSIAILIGLTVQRHTSSYTGLITFICLYFAMFWIAWRAAVRITEPGTRLGRLLRIAEK
jgi:hypothetical protein